MGNGANGETQLILASGTMVELLARHARGKLPVVANLE